MSYPPHPYAELFPFIDEKENGDVIGPLIHDIRKNGLLEPIVLYQGRILDGRNRLGACASTGVKPRYVEFEGDDAAALQFVISKNLYRRHLSKEQRAMVAARIATAKLGQNQHTKKEDAQICAPSVKAVAKQMKVSPRSVTSAKKVIKSGDGEVIAAVEKGELAVSRAAEIVELPKEERPAAVEKAKERKSRAPRAKAEPQPIDVTETDERVEALGPLLAALDAARAACGLDFVDAAFAKWRAAP